MAAMHQGLWVLISRMHPMELLRHSARSVLKRSAGTNGRKNLERAENAHVCDPDERGKLAYFWNPAQD